MSTSISLATKVRATLVTLVLGGALIFAGGQVFQKLSQQKQAPRITQEAPRMTVRTKRVTRGDHRDILRGYGRVRALRAADVSAEVSGLVLEVSPVLEAGNLVDGQQDLVVIDPRDLSAIEASAAATVAQRTAVLEGERSTQKSIQKRLAVARKEKEISERRLKRLLELEQTSSSARDDVDVQRLQTAAMERAVLTLEQQLDSSRKSVQRIEAEVKAAVAAHERAQNDLARTRIRAPYAGTVVRRQVQKGTRVGPGTVLFSIVDGSVVEVPVKIGASRRPEIEPGARASLLLSEDAPPVWTGKVARIAPTVDARESTITVYLEVKQDDASAPVLPGAFVVGEIDGALFEDVIVLPRTALLGGAAFVVKRDAADSDTGMVEERRPEIRRLLPEVALISAGIQAGEEVVLTNLEQLTSGLPVKTVRRDSRATDANGSGDK